MGFRVVSFAQNSLQPLKKQKFVWKKKPILKILLVNLSCGEVKVELFSFIARFLFPKMRVWWERSRSDLPQGAASNGLGFVYLDRSRNLRRWAPDSDEDDVPREQVEALKTILLGSFHSDVWVSFQLNQPGSGFLVAEFHRARARTTSKDRENEQGYLPFERTTLAPQPLPSALTRDYLTSLNMLAGGQLLAVSSFLDCAVLSDGTWSCLDVGESAGRKGRVEPGPWWERHVHKIHSVDERCVVVPCCRRTLFLEGQNRGRWVLWPEGVLSELCVDSFFSGIEGFLARIETKSSERWEGAVAKFSVERGTGIPQREYDFVPPFRPECLAEWSLFGRRVCWIGGGDRCALVSSKGTAIFDTRVPAMRSFDWDSTRVAIDDGSRLVLETNRQVWRMRRPETLLELCVVTLDEETRRELPLEELCQISSRFGSDGVYRPVLADPDRSGEER